MRVTAPERRPAWSPAPDWTPAEAAPAARLRALVGLFRAGLRRRLGVRIARYFGWQVGAAFALTLVVLVLAADTGLIGPIVTRGFAWLTWVAGGLAALSIAAAPDPARDPGGLGVLATARGYAPVEQRRAFLLAEISVVLGVQAMPASLLVLAALALSRTASAAITTTILAAGGAAYLLVCSGVLGVLVHVARELSPSHPRKLLAGLVLGPYLLSTAWTAPKYLSLPDLAQFWLARLVALAGGAG